MTQPSIDFADGTFPPPEVSDIAALTAAVRDLTSAVDNLTAEVSLRQDPSPKTQITASDRVPPGSALVGDFSVDWGDPSVRRIDPADPEAVEEFWEEFAEIGEVGDVQAIHDALVGPADEAVGVAVMKPQAAYEAAYGDGDRPGRNRAPKMTLDLDDVPEGWVADLEPPRKLTKEVALGVSIDRDEDLWVRRVGRETGHNFYDWEFFETDEPNGSPSWGCHIEQVKAMGLTFSDFRPPQP